MYLSHTIEKPILLNSSTAPVCTETFDNPLFYKRVGLPAEKFQPNLIQIGLPKIALHGATEFGVLNCLQPHAPWAK